MNRYKIMNLKENYPFVDEAIALLEIEISSCKQEGIFVLKVIHGYGSSGKGGEIKKALQMWRIRAKAQGKIIDFVKGENLSDNNPVFKNIKEVCPEVLGDLELYRTNAGVSLIWILK